MKHSIPTNLFNGGSIRSRLRGLQLSIALCVLGFFASSAATWADAASDPAAPPVAANPSPQISAATSAENAEKPTTPTNDGVNGLRERLAERDKICEAKGWGGFLCIKNGSLIDSAVFLADYKAKHPNEQIRLVTWKHSALDRRARPNEFKAGLRPKKLEEGVHPQGFGDIVADEERPVNAFAVYTLGDELHIRNPHCGDHVSAFDQAKDITTLSDRELIKEYEEFRIPGDTNTVGSRLDGDDENLQLNYAEMRLKAAGVPAFIIPATEAAAPDGNLILIFTIHESVFAYRPNHGLFELSKDAFTQLESQQVADTSTP
ncbi:MAG TPA: hypothetical protein VNV15_05600 [Opitutaceae bacterium]|jgi:hypothetical protein|nr:hypothetical protein [Opitutaceae bacterium]